MLPSLASLDTASNRAPTPFDESVAKAVKILTPKWAEVRAVLYKTDPCKMRNNEWIIVKVFVTERVNEVKSASMPDEKLRTFINMVSSELMNAPCKIKSTEGADKTVYESMRDWFQSITRR